VHQNNLVDVVIPTYNETVQLKTAIESVLIQGEIVKTIFVVDDGSCTEVRSFLENSIAKIDKVNLIFLEHTGNPALVRNQGIERCKSDWIAFLDADDSWLSNKLESQLLIAREHDLDFVATNAIRCNDDQENGIYFPKYEKFMITTRDLVKENLVINSSTLIKLSHLKSIEGYASENHVRGIEDFATWLRLSTVCRIGLINQPFVMYQVSEKSFSRNQSPILYEVALLDFYFWLKRHNIKGSRFQLFIRILRRITR